ncbi:MAG: maleylpyruvate isomerase family mycothiol-dependent enzyme [Aeromicrobium sp.]
MTEESTSDRYKRLAHLFGNTVRSLVAEGWDKPSPCDGWSARDVLNHVLTSEADIVSKVGLSIERSVDASVHPFGAWCEVRDAMQAILDDPEKAGLTYESLGQPTTISDSVDRFICFDLIMHRWDIARAAGEGIVWDPQDIDFANEFLDSMGSMFYDYGASAPALPVPDDASDRDKLLGRAGRDPQWSAS